MNIRRRQLLTTGSVALAIVLLGAVTTIAMAFTPEKEASSPLGQSGELLAKLAGTGDWQEGHRFGSSAAQSEVAAWAEGLGISG